jgi:hypothetical protein
VGSHLSQKVGKGLVKERVGSPAEEACLVEHVLVLKEQRETKHSGKQGQHAHDAFVLELMLAEELKAKGDQQVLNMKSGSLLNLKSK